MNRRLFLTSSAAALAACHRDQRPGLNLFNWSSYVGPETIARFEAESGARVRYSVYESNEEMLARVLSGNSGWDIVFPTHYFLTPMREEGLLAPLDHNLLPGLRNIDAAFRGRPWDPDLRYSVPYMWNATGIIHNAKQTGEITAWKDLWSPKLAGRMTMLDDPVEVFSAALFKLGYSISSRDAAELGKAQAEAAAQKKLLRAYLNAEVRDQLVAGDVLAAQLWSTTAQQAIDAAPHLRFVYPSEGFPLYLDSAVILRESPRKELAHKFLDYVLRPEVAADIASSARTGTANAAARAILPKEARENATLYPPPEVTARGQWFETLPPATQRLRDRMWTEIKSGG